MKSWCFILWPLVPTISDLADYARNQSTDSQNSKAFHNGLSAWKVHVSAKKMNF